MTEAIITGSRALTLGAIVYRDTGAGNAVNAWYDAHFLTLTVTRGAAQIPAGAIRANVSTRATALVRVHEAIPPKRATDDPWGGVAGIGSQPGLTTDSLGAEILCADVAVLADCSRLGARITNAGMGQPGGAIAAILRCT